MIEEFIIAKVCTLNGRRVYLYVDRAGTPEQALEQLQTHMRCKWGKNETFVLFKMMIGGITTIFPNDIPQYEDIIKIEKDEKKDE